MVLNTLSGRFLVLTVLFVMIVEVLIFVPSVARFRQDYLQNKLDLAQLAALATLGTPEGAVSAELETELLETAGVRSVILRRDGVRELVLSGTMPPQVLDHFDISTTRPVELITDALRVFLNSGDRVIHVSGMTRMGSEGGVEIDVDETPLRAAMLDYGARVLWVSLVISLATAALLFFAVRRLMVRPIKRVVNHMIAYRDSPEDTTRIISPSSSTLEFREAESALHDLEVRLTASLRQKERLAALGSAVAKISHDLRNMLATAQILTDGIDASQDPRVRRTAPKLVNSLDRAVALCERTLTFGKAEEPKPELERVPLAPLVEEVAENERQAAGRADIRIVSKVPRDLHLLVDPDQLFRVLSNLVRNAVQAIVATGQGGTVTVTGHQSDGMAFIRVCDTGPGLPAKAREHLFKPFEGGARQGGTGLGLVIAAEIIRGHGGELQLEVTDTDGTIFAITLPAVEAARAAGQDMKAGVHLTPLNPPFIAAYVAIAVWLLHRFVPLYPFSFPGQRLLAAALIFAGLMLVIQSLKGFLKADTTFDPTELDAATTLVTDGLFRYSRNPIYLGMALILAGLGLAWGTIWIIPGVPAFCTILTRTQILPEERALEKIFGGEYLDYKRRVRRWI